MTIAPERRGARGSGVGALLVALAVGLAPGAAAARDAAAVDEVRGDDLDEVVLGPRSNLRTRADEVAFDARQRTLELSGNVRVDAPPFHLRSERIRLSRTRFGVEIEGKGRLAFCPCLGTPLTVEFSRAIVAPPGDLVLEDPKLELYGVPIAYLPYFWLRSDEKAGVLPPDVAYRGQDGLFLGEGVHLPWRDGAARHALDLRGGAYLVGGFVADARLRTPVSVARMRYDRLPGAPAPELPGVRASPDDGLLVDARGAAGAGEARAAWDVDVLRGRRGVASTSDLDAAAKPWDRASAEGAVRVGPFVAASGVRAVTRRGGGIVDVESAGPLASLRTSGAAAAGVTYDATVEGGALRVAGTAASLASAAPPPIVPDTVSYARAELGALAARTLGALAAELSVRGAGDVVREARRSGADRAASARGRLGVPLARRWAPPADAPNDPLVHVVEPFVEAAVIHARGDGLLGALPGRGASVVDGMAPVTHAGVATSVGRWGRREALDVALSGGAAYGSERAASGVRPLARGRLAATLAWVGATADAGLVGGDGGTSGGLAALGRVRFGPAGGARLLGSVGARVGVDPVLARALTDAPLEPAAGFLAREGTTGGAGVVVPWSRQLSTSAGADADLSRGELVAARAGLELHDRCACLTLRAMGSHRIGRDGVDVWLALDFAADR